MKSKLILSLVIGLCWSSAVIVSVAAKVSHESLQPINSIAAVVNNDIITESSLDTQVRLFRKQLQLQNQKIPAPAALKKQVLNQLIGLKLQLQQALKEGISISEEDVDQAIGNIAKQNRINTATLRQQVEKQGLTYADYRRQIQDQLAIAAAQRQAIKEHITVSDQEVAAEMRTLTKKTEEIPLYHLLAILVPVPTTPAPEQIQAAEQKAKAVIKSLKQGEKFEDAAILLSAGSEALQGGDMGWKQLTQLSPQIAANVAAATSGQILGPMQTPEGFLIVKVAAIKSSSAEHKLSPENMRKEVRYMIFQRKYEQAVQNWVTKLKSGAFIKIMDA